MCKRLFFLTSFVLVLALVGNAGAQPTGKILFEYWFDIGGTAVSDLTGAAGYPDSPDDSEWLDKFEGPVDMADNYGSRARGYLYPPADGDYTFWISGDDYEELYLSADDDPANSVLIANVPGWTNHLEWGKYPEQQSAPITLVAGQKYYIEGIMKEGGGGDSMTVGWTGPEIGEEIVILDGAYLSPVLRPAARGPVPADGAIDYDGGSVEWTAGDGAVSHKAYLSADATVDESDLAAETELTIHLATLDPGATYYWRVDEVDADGVVTEGKVWSFSTLPLEAHFPSPADGAEDIESGTTLSWTAGKGVIMHDVYFGTDEAAVAASDPSTFKGKAMVTSFDPGPLELFTTYYWKIDEFSVTGTNPGPVWSFSAPGYIIIAGEETTLDYDNTAEPYVSELALDVPADLRFGGVADLTLRFQGGPASEGSLSLDEATGTYSVTGSGADVWGNSDQFYYGYRELTGDATIVARVVDNGTGSNNWAKGGVMIRESLDADSKHMIMALTGGDGGGIGFQGRSITSGSSTSFHGDVTAEPPYWVKLTRAGNTITAYSSADGVDWELFTDTSPDGAHTNPIDVEMADPVLIGLFVTSHAAGELRTFTFDNVDIDGDISADDASTDIGIPVNAPAPIYVALEDSTGAVASVTHGNPAATNIESWRQWTVPLDKFEGVDASSSAKLYIGVGDGQPGGTGSIVVDDVFVVKPDPAAGDVTAPGDVVQGVPNDGLMDGDNFGWPGAETPDLATDDNTATKFLHFKGELEPTGFQIEPASGASIVTGLTLTTANDAPERDPISYELSGSNDSIDGPYELIASGDIVDFAQETAWPRFTMNATKITFENDVAYKYYQVMFPTVRNPGSANSMQIAEVELIPAPAPADVTVPGDIVKGVPDDGDWPGGEYPALAIDDKDNTKYLHFKGEEGITGIQVTPLDGASIVAGLTFTTANDCAGRDPISFELSGSNDSIDGPYTLIASGDIVDFAQEEEWPRFTMNATPILLDNVEVYSHYQIIFTAIRGPLGGCVDHMQIAEVEFIGVLE